MNPVLQLGDILLVNDTKWNLFSYAQHVTSGKPYTHVALGIGPVAGYDSIFEADLQVTTRPFTHLYLHKEYEYEQYRPINFTYKELFPFLHKLYNEHAEELYGYSQIPWFIYKGIMRVLGKDVSKQANWFSDGIICTGIGLLYLQMLSEKETVLKVPVSKFNIDTTWASDIAGIIHTFPKVFKLIDQYKIKK